MNWYDLSDRDLDSLFRKISESANIPYKEEAWQSLERKLNRWEIFSSIVWKIVGGGIVLMIGGISVLLYNATSDDPYIKNLHGEYPVISKEEINTENLQAGSGLIIPDTTIPRNNDQAEAFTGANERKGIIQENEVRNEKTTRISKSFIREQSRTENVNSEFAIGSNSRHNEIPEATKKPNIDFNSSGQYDLPFLNSRYVPVFTDIKKPADPVFKSEPEEVISTGRKQHKTISLNVSIGPDLSGVNNAGFRAGTFAGLGLEFYIMKRVSFLAGINHSRKRYSVKEEYNMPYNTNSSYDQSPDKVDIACHVIDIPLNLYYSIIDTQKRRLFIGGGVSSYLMLTEEYYFDYGYSYDPDLLKKYEIRNENQHYFGILNLSAGYTGYINKKWAWQVEPYYKLPLQDIAAAQVRLNSFGALITLKYWVR